MITLDASQITNNIIAQMISAFVIFLVGLIVLDNKNLLNPWIYKFFKDGKLAYYLKLLVNFLTHPLLRVGVILLSLVSINLGRSSLFSSIIIFIISLSFLWKKTTEKIFNPAPSIVDGFENLDRWGVKNGTPEIEDKFGKPSPDLILKFIPDSNQPVRTHSFVFHKEIKRSKGIIECDFYLEKNSIFNIVFLADLENDNWYMVRYDSRHTHSDGFLIKNKGKDVFWQDLKMSGTQTPTYKWVRARVEFDENIVRMFKDDELLIEFENPNKFGENIGFFNELADVHIDNFSFIKK